MSRTEVTMPRRLPAGEVAGFTALVALVAIFSDAAVGHGLTWENDPYWTYWVTKTFLIATIYGLGTAWFGVGVARGAAITAVHTIVLTVYYWSLSPIGLPSQPEWLDLEHTWITGLPIHFGVLYLGYLAALWVWRRRQQAVEERLDSASLGMRALVVGIVILVVTGGIASLALGEFPGITWFLVRLLLTVPFLLIWWALAGRDRTAAVVGAVVLALMWATYGHFLGPSGLPDTPLRIFDTAAPEASVEWLSYTQLWVISLPIYFATMLVILLVDSMASWGRTARRTTAAAAVVALPLLSTGFVASGTEGPEGTNARLSASGAVQVETGAFYSNQFESGTGDIDILATDVGGRVTPLPPHDRLDIQATIEAAGTTYEVTVSQPVIEEPRGRHTTWWGVGLHVEHHGNSGIGTSRLPGIESELAAFGLGEVSVDGEQVGVGLPVHVMTSEGKFPGGATLELDVGTEDGAPIPGLPDGHLRVLWTSHDGEVPRDTVNARYIGGSLVLLLLLAGALYLNRGGRAA